MNFSLDVPRLSTYRRSLEGNSEEITHIGAFNANSILQHITRESMPLVVSKSEFTTFRKRTKEKLENQNL